MAAFIQFYPTNSEDPISLSLLDELICKALGVEVHPTKYHAGWFDIIGFSLAMGSTMEELRERYNGIVEEDGEDSLYQKMLEILDYIEEGYSTRAWHGRG